jgi:FAD/FMN-containing dehydrogenase
MSWQAPHLGERKDDVVRLGLTNEQLSSLRMELRGAALGPTDPGFEERRIPFNAMYADRPDVVVRPTGTADVVAAVRFAREHDLELVVRGGGHSVGGLSTADGGLVIDLSSMRGVEVDPGARLARVQGGAVLGELDRETQLFGLAAPGGVVSQTGVAGLTLGGGYGWLRRKYGLACDSVVSAQVVCADGEVRTASATTNPDLFWAIRGGGGNFGIVTSFTFKLHPVGPIVAFAGVFYPVEAAADVLDGYREYFTDAPDEVTAEALSITMPADPSLPEPVRDRECLVVGAVYAGDTAEGMDVLQPLRELATPLADITQPMPFTVVQSAFDGLFPSGQLRAYWKAAYVAELSDAVIEIIARASAERPSPLTFVDTYPMGGAISRIGTDETAFAERSAPFMVSVHGNWSHSENDSANITWVRDIWGNIDRLGLGSTYLNFSGAEDAEPSRAAVGFGPNLERLARVKSTYDPENLFHHNNNVAPSGT